MVAAPIISLRLSARGDDDGGNSEDGSWGPLQVATPVVVGVVLLLLFAIYLIWRRKPLGKRSYNYYSMRPDWVTKIQRMFVPRRRRYRLHHSSDPMTLDDSMRLPGLDTRHTRPQRSDSSDSQTPLTTTSYPLSDYPPKNMLSDSPPPVSKPSLRWWWLFGSRPREVRSEEPDMRWRIDGPDGSSTGHGHSSHGHEEHHGRHTGVLADVPEDPREEVDGSVMRIGDDFTSTMPNPMTHPFSEQVRAARGMSPVPEHSPLLEARAPMPVVSAPHSGRGTPAPSVHRGLPPSYNDSQSHRPYPLEEDIIRLTHSRSPMTVLPPVRTPGYLSPRALHERELSSESFLAAQTPMVATSIY